MGMVQITNNGIVTFASFTCQPRGALEDRMEENQRFRELAIVANPLENRLFLASVTMPTDHSRRLRTVHRDFITIADQHSKTSEGQHCASRLETDAICGRGCARLPAPLH